MEPEATANTYKATVGQASMEVMDVIDDDLMELVNRLDRFATRLAKELVERGIGSTHAVQMVGGFAVGAAVDAIHGD